MKTFFKKIIQFRKAIMAIFFILVILSIFGKSMVRVNYDMNDYLPEDAPSTVALDVMNGEFEGGIPNARIMIKNVSISQALEYKEKLLQIQGVTDVTWLDDAIDIKTPLETADKDTVETYYKDNAALFSVTVDEESMVDTVASIRELIGDENSMTGAAVSTAVATTSTENEIKLIAVIAVLFVLFILAITTTSWIEPIIVMVGLGVAIIINAGSNIIFGEISFVTNAAGSILQLAVSLDYSVFLIHRFEESRQEFEDPKEAMNDALCKSVSSILSSGLTTVIGFLALVVMRFGIGSDLGLALAKGVALSLIIVFVFMPGLILASYKWMDKTKHRYFMPSFKKFGKVITKLMIPLSVVFILLVVPAYLSSIHNSYYYGNSHIFAKGTQLGDDTAAIEDTFGKRDTYVVLVPKGNNEAETNLSNELENMPEVKSIISYVGLAGAQIPYEYLDADTLSKLESDNYSRMVLTVEEDYEGDTTFTFIERLRSTLQEYYPDTYYLAGEGISTYDLMDTITADMVKVNLIAIGAVFVVLLLTMKSVVLPVVLVMTIETAIWINLSIPYYMSSSIFYIAYLIISSIQLGATVDYAILFSERYKENRLTLNKKDSIIQTVSNVTVSIFTSGISLTVVGFALGKFSTHGLLAQLGTLLGQGTICSMVAVFFVLPGFLYLTDRKKGAVIYE